MTVSLYDLDDRRLQTSSSVMKSVQQTVESEASTVSLGLVPHIRPLTVCIIERSRNRAAQLLLLQGASLDLCCVALPAAGWNAIPDEGLQSEIMERVVVRRYRDEIASLWRGARDVTQEYDEVSGFMRSLPTAMRVPCTQAGIASDSVIADITVSQYRHV
jgi:hypothetical protein